MSTLLNPFQVLLKIQTEPSQGVGAPSHQLPTNKLDQLTICAALSGTSKNLGFIQPILGLSAMVTVLVLIACVNECWSYLPVRAELVIRKANQPASLLVLALSLRRWLKLLQVGMFTE